MRKYIGKILIIVVPLIAAFILLYPTYQAGQLEAKKKFAYDQALKAKNTNDSLAVIEKFDERYGKDLEKAKSQRLKLGLDLRGGMYVTLEVDVVKLIEESAQPEAVDDLFADVIDKTRAEAKQSDKAVIDIFMDNFNRIARPKGKSLITYFDIGDMRDVTEDKIIDKLKKDAGDAIDQAKEVIRSRIDKYGIAEPTIQKQGTRRIVLELPGVSNQEEMRKLLQTTARLEFNLVKNNVDAVRLFYKIDKLLSNELKRKNASGIIDTTLQSGKTSEESSTTTENDSTATASNDSTGLDSAKAKKASDTADPYAGLSREEASRRYQEDHPFGSLFYTNFISPDEERRSQPVGFNMNPSLLPEGDYTFMIQEASLDKFNRILARPEVKALIPKEIRIVKEAKPDPRIEKQSKVKMYYFYAIKSEPELKGNVVTDARATFDQTTNQPEVLMGMNSDGADQWARITGANIKKRIAIVLDDQVYSAPTVQNKITGGSSQITGMANIDEARLLEIVLKAGALKAPVQIIEERVVGPSLGEDSIKDGFMASGIAFGLVVLFMLIYYTKGGIIANLSVLINVIIVISVLAAFNGTLTLPGIAGIILTIGMAVDANILIFERIREELYRGRSLKSAVDEGFSKALRAIIDTHVTTSITGL
ncbi:MAG: protein translocase subunit SecD, partial [FCB group bacterium]